MSRHYTREDYAAVTGAFSYIVAKTLARITEESGVDARIVKRIVRELEERNTFERRGNHYRLDSANDWRTTDPPNVRREEPVTPIARTSTVAPGRERTREARLTSYLKEHPETSVAVVSSTVRKSKLRRDVAALLAMDSTDE